MVKIVVNQDKCVACGRCTEMCPQVFKLCLEANCKVRVAEKLTVEDERCASRASDECPVEAIKIEE